MCSNSGHVAHELLVLGLRAEPHDALDARAVVPGAVEQDDLAGGGQVRDVALEVPLRLLALRRRGQGHHPAHPWAGPLGDPLDHAALAGGVAPLEDHDELQALGPDVLLHDHELALELQQLFLELLGGQLLGLLAGRSSLFVDFALAMRAPLLDACAQSMRARWRCGTGWRDGGHPSLPGDARAVAATAGRVRRDEHCAGRSGPGLRNGNLVLSVWTQLASGGGEEIDQRGAGPAPLKFATSEGLPRDSLPRRSPAGGGFVQLASGLAASWASSLRGA